MLKRLVVLATMLAVPGIADAQAGNQAVIAAQPQRYEDVQPKCEALRGGHFKVKSGATYVKTGLESADNRARLMGDAERVLKEAITNDNQGDSPVAWYWLGRVYLYRGDVAGADSALARAVQLAPDCADELRQAKQSTYSALMRPAATHMDAGNQDSALVYLKQAASFLPESPYAYQNMGIIYFNRKQLDSAAMSFEKAVAAAELRAATDTAYASLRTTTTFNLAAVYQNAGRHKDAIEALRRYLAWSPSDNDARRALAVSFRATGMVDSAQAIEAQLLASASSGNANPGAGVINVFDLGVNAFNDKKFDEAARAFHQVLQDNPYYRDALYNLANTYISMENADSLISVGQRLVAIDPMSEGNLRLLAAGYQKKKNNDQTLKYVIMLGELPFNIEVTAFQPSVAATSLTGSATGREAKDINDRVIAPVPVTLVFEFLDSAGTVVATQEVPVNALAVGVKQDLTVTAQGANVIAWRYRRK